MDLLLLKTKRCQKLACYCLLTAAIRLVYAQETATSTEQVVIQGAPDQASLQRDIVAGKIILGRAWLEKNSAHTLAESLKRESSVSVNGDGKISLKGLVGYTQILLDGHPVHGGIDPLKMDTGFIERVEIIHAASADTGAFGIAGTINVITRSRRKLLPGQFSLYSAFGPSGKQKQGSIQSGWKDTSGLTVNVQAQSSETDADQLSQIDWRSDLRTSLERNHHRAQTNDLNFSPSLNWKISDLDELLLNFSGSRFKWRYEDLSHQFARSSQELDFSRPVNASSQTWQNSDNFSVSGQWRHKLAKGGLSTLYIKLERENSSLQKSHHSIWGGNLVAQFDHSKNVQDSRLRTQWLLASVNLEGHKVQYGILFNHAFKEQQLSNVIDGLMPDSEWLGQQNSDARTSEFALWLQDHWQVTPELDLKLGWRQEKRWLDLTTGTFRTASRTLLAAPSLNLAWRIDPEEKHVLSLGIAKSYSPFSANMLDPRPEITGTTLCNAHSLCAGNDAKKPDRVGNPYVKYEKSWGIDLSLDNQWGEASQWSIRAYKRWINDALTWQTELITVPWGSVPRWVYHPVNSDNARAEGVSIALDSQLSDWFEGAPNLNFNAALNWNRSSISAIPGPDNRIENQQPWSWRMGITYKAQDYPLELQSDFLLNPASWWKASKNYRIYTDTQRQLSAKLVWTINSQSKLGFTVQNILPLQEKTMTELYDDQLTRLISTQRPNVSYALRYEHRFN